MADWLKRLSEADHAAGSAAFRVQSSSEAIWEGKAGDACRDRLAYCGADADKAKEAIDWLIWGLNLFASDIDTVRAHMDQCLQIAHDNGLTVTGTVIHEPQIDAADTAPDGAGGDMPGLDPHAQEHKQLVAKRDAYLEIEAIANDERNRERTAHRTLLKAINGSNGIIDALLADPKTWVLRGLVAAGTAHGTHAALAENATKMEDFAKNFERLSADSTLPAATREAWLAKLMTNVGVDQRGAEGNAKLLLGGGQTKAGEFILGNLARTAGDRGSPKKSLTGIGKLFNVVGMLGTGYFTVQDILDGKPVGKSIWANFGGLAFSTTVSSVAVAGAGGAVGAATTSPVTVAGLGVGFAASATWTYFQDHDLRDLYRDLGGDGGNSPADQSDEQRKARYGW